MNDAQAIEWMGRIEGKLDGTLGQIGALTQGAQDHERRVTTLELTVNGNGTPGLKQNQAAMRAACDNRHAPKPGMAVLRGVIQTVIAAAILAVASAMFAAWKSHN